MKNSKFKIGLLCVVIGMFLGALQAVAGNGTTTSPFSLLYTPNTWNALQTAPNLQIYSSYTSDGSGTSNGWPIGPTIGQARDAAIQIHSKGGSGSLQGGNWYIYAADPNGDEGNYPTLDFFDLITNYNTPFSIYGGTSGENGMWVSIPAHGMYTFNSDGACADCGTPDTAFSRDAANVVDIGNGTYKDKSGTVNTAVLNLNGHAFGTITNAASGKIVLGTITIEWGFSPSSAGASPTITFPTAFSAAPYSINTTGLGGSNCVNPTGTPSSSSFTTYTGSCDEQGGAAAFGFYWTAIGST